MIDIYVNNNLVDYSLVGKAHILIASRPPLS